MCLHLFCVFVCCQTEDGLRIAHYSLEFRRVLVLYRGPQRRSPTPACGSDREPGAPRAPTRGRRRRAACEPPARAPMCPCRGGARSRGGWGRLRCPGSRGGWPGARGRECRGARSEEHTSELQSLMRTSYAVFCLKKKNISSYFNTSHTNTT